MIFQEFHLQVVAAFMHVFFVKRLPSLRMYVYYTRNQRIVAQFSASGDYLIRERKGGQDGCQSR
jgi:hypothetical protein